jgi:SPP1 gp7 family putative phage head morphogenesis protein
MHGSMKQDIFRRMSDAVVTSKPIGDLKQELKDEYSYYKSKENPQDWEISRVVRTELANGTILMKLTKWKEMGFKKVEWIVVEDEKLCPKCKDHNHEVFEIDYLLENDDDRIPKHPQCRCTLVAYE